MYVTVTCDGTGRLVAYRPYDTPATEPGDSAVTAAICPPSAVDRTTGTLSHPYQYAAAGPALVTVPVQSPAASVDDLNAPTVAVCIHSFSHRMFVVGVFTGPNRAEQWWHPRINRFAETGAVCHVVPLTAPTGAETTAGEPA